MDPSALKSLLQEVIKRRLPNASIIDVKVERTLDFEGEEVLEVTVIFEAKSDLDSERVAGLIRHLRPRLEEHGERSFPIMSFVSRKEAERRGLAVG